MKIINNPKVVVSEDDLKKLLVRFIEKKTGKKVVDVSLVLNQSVEVSLQTEETDLEEPKNG
jgi:hypothetical protein